MTKVYVIKWSQNCTRTIRNGVVGIPKYLKSACKAGYFNIFGYAKNTTSEGPSSILRPLYNRYFCHITIKKWSPICTRTIRNVFFKDILFLGLFPIVIPIVNLNANLFRPWRSWAIILHFFVADQCAKRHNENSQPTFLDVFEKKSHALIQNR